MRRRIAALAAIAVLLVAGGALASWPPDWARGFMVSIAGGTTCHVVTRNGSGAVTSNATGAVTVNNCY